MKEHAWQQMPKLPAVAYARWSGTDRGRFPFFSGPRKSCLKRFPHRPTSDGCLYVPSLARTLPWLPINAPVTRRMNERQAAGGSPGPGELRVGQGHSQALGWSPGSRPLPCSTVAALSLELDLNKSRAQGSRQQGKSLARHEPERHVCLGDVVKSTNTINREQDGRQAFKPTRLESGAIHGRRRSRSRSSGPCDDAPSSELHQT